MSGGRSRLEIGAYGEINVTRSAAGSYRAEARHRDWDGGIRKVTASGTSRSAAQAALRVKVGRRPAHAGLSDGLHADSSFASLGEAWLADVRIRPDLSDGTRDRYERSLESLVLPTFGELRLREISTGRVDQFLKQQAARSYARAKHARVVLNLMFNFALRLDAITRNPVVGCSRLRKPPATPRALTPTQVDAVRTAIRDWRSTEPVHGPRPDGLVRDLIEVLLGSGQRIGEALALRKCDIDDSVVPMRISVSGTIVVLRGRPVARQDHPKTGSSSRMIAVPSWTAEVLRRRLDALVDEPDEHLLFVTRCGTPLSPHNARRTLRRVLAAAGLGDLDITPHSFRRTGATAIARASSAETAATFLGHSSAEITKAHYIEPLIAAPDTAPAEYLEAFAPRARPSADRLTARK
ncbi:tyrosine-type recombinase/integrase [uncultured Amnibacterium sp.]|uniref:tyrosine-type recombinase/integrase n=1 Tax=uncultured Amnibacterium sp. TaxID=1631851 RepID=UPI0035CA9A63